MKPFLHQEEVARLVQEHDKGIFNIACGCGKSYSMMLASKHFFVTVVFAPTKNLVSQLADNFASMDDVKVFIVNSDNPVNMTQLRRAKMYKKKRIVIVANYQSVHVVKDICDTTDLQIDVVFLDEAHNVTSDKKRSVFHKESNIEKLSDSESVTDSITEDDTESIASGSSYTETSNGSTTDSNERFTMSDISRIVSKKTFSFTATPTKSMLKHPEIYGPVLLQYSYAQGVLDRHVKNIDTIIECYGDTDDKSCLDAGYERLIPAITRFIDSGDFKRIIVYTSRVKECGKKLATVDGLSDRRNMFPKEFTIHAVTADTPVADRNAIFETFRRLDNDVHVILSCMTISEGIDLPSCDAVVLLDSSKSVVKVVQRTLRACRLTPDERTKGEWQNAACFYPINVPESSLIELLQAARDETKEVITKHVHRHDFEFAMAVVHFLKQNLGLEILFDVTNKAKKQERALQQIQEMIKRGVKKVVGKVSFNLSSVLEWSAEEFKRSGEYLQTNMRYISLEEQFESNLERLRVFVHENNRLPSTHSKNQEEKQLGKWCSSRRGDYKKNQLSHERIKELESLPQWSWDPFEDQYQKSLEDLKKFIKENNRLPSQESKNLEEKKLGGWCQHRRKDYKKNQLSHERIKELESLPQWSWDPFEDQYQNSLKDLKKFIKENNRLPSKESKNLEEKHLGSWCSNRRNDYKKNQLSHERIKELEGIPLWSWDLLEDKYQKSLEDLKKFIKENNRLPTQYEENLEEKKLGGWCQHRRKDYKVKRLSQERIKDLESIPQWSWDLLEDQYQKSLEDLKKFIKDNSRLPSTTAKNPEEKQLGRWCSSQRNVYKKNQLSQERVKEIESLLHWSWDPTEDQYQKSLEDLKKFMKVNNRLPSQDAKNQDEKQLGIWCQTRRIDYKKNQLSRERIKVLESIQQWSWDPITDKFERNLSDIKKFLVCNKRLPSYASKDITEKNLGRWCQSRRTDYRTNKLSKENIVALESIPKWSWDPFEDQYQKLLEDLKKFTNENNRLPSSKANNPEEKQLGSWCGSRRQDYKNKKLSEERIKELESLPLWYWSNDTKTTKSIVLPTNSKHDKTSAIKNPRQLSDLSEYHKRFKTLSSKNLHKEFQEDPELFNEYHEVAEKNWQGFKAEDRPVNMASRLVDRIHKQVNMPLNIADFGAGVGTLRELISQEHTLTGFDHVSVKDWIIARDMRDTGLESASQDLCIFSMSLWGSNWEEYLTEASRVLKPNGHVIIINKTRGWFVDEENNPLSETRIGKALGNVGLVIIKVSGVDTLFTTCVAMKPLSL